MRNHQTYFLLVNSYNDKMQHILTTQESETTSKVIANTHNKKLIYVTDQQVQSMNICFC